MDRFLEFMGAAAPWIALALLIAVFAVRETGRKKTEKHENYGSEGMALGICLGTAVSTALHVNIGIGMIVGMALGLFIGSGTAKK